MFGIWGHKKAAEITYYGLHATQHRGQEGAGIASSDGTSLNLHKNVGLLNDVFERAELEQLTGEAGVGLVHDVSHHATGYENVQPHLFNSKSGSIALAHWGTCMKP